MVMTPETGLFPQSIQGAGRADADDNKEIALKTCSIASCTFWQTPLG